MGRVRAADGGTSWTMLYHGGGCGILFVSRRRFAWASTCAGRKSYLPIVRNGVEVYVMRRCSTFLALIRLQLVFAILVDVQRDDVCYWWRSMAVEFDRTLKSQLERVRGLLSIDVYFNLLLMHR